MSTKKNHHAAAPFGAFEWSVARRYLSATRTGAGVSLISIIAFTGIALSVATMLVVMSVFEGFRTNLFDQLLSVNGHAFVSTIDEPLTDDNPRAARLAQVPGVTRVTPVLLIDAYMIGPSGQSAARIHGISPDDLRGVEEVTGDGHVVGGSFDEFGVGRNGGNLIAIGDTLSYILGVIPGDTVTVVTPGGAETPFGTSPTTEKQYTIGAVFNIGNAQLDQFYVYMPLSQAQLLARKKGQVTELEIRVEAPLEVDRYREGLAAAAGDGVRVSDWRVRHPDIFNAVQVEGALMRILMLLIVAVATLLIISGLVMLVKDKRSDIAVLRTMGATRGMIMRIFLLVGASIGVTGAFIGVALGALIATNLGLIERGLSALFNFRVFNPNVYYLDEIPASFQWGEVAVVLGFTLGMSFLSSVYPAWRASKLDPVEALRYE